MSDGDPESTMSSYPSVAISQLNKEKKCKISLYDLSNLQ
jgi:hypothetical protein